MGNAVFKKTVENVRKHRDIKLVTTETKNELFIVRARLSYNKMFFSKFISHGNEKKQLFMNKSVYLGLSILEISRK